MLQTSKVRNGPRRIPFVVCSEKDSLETYKKLKMFSAPRRQSKTDSPIKICVSHFLDVQKKNVINDNRQEQIN